MNTQPEALRIANELANLRPYEIALKCKWDAVEELRRLHAANMDCVEHFNAVKAERDGLLAALEAIVLCTPRGNEASMIARAAITKAKA